MTKAAKKKDLPVYDFSLVLPKDLNNVWEDCKNILEIGSGPGKLSHYFRKVYKA